MLIIFSCAHLPFVYLLWWDISSGLFKSDCLFFLCVCSVAQSFPTLGDPMDCSPPGSSVHGIFQAELLEQVAISYSRGSSPPRDRTFASAHGPWAVRKRMMNNQVVGVKSVVQVHRNSSMAATQTPCMKGPRKPGVWKVLSLPMGLHEWATQCPSPSCIIIWSFVNAVFD